MVITGLVFQGIFEKRARVYIRLENMKIEEKTKESKKAKPLLKLRPLDTNNIGYFTESTRYKPSCQRKTSLLFLHFDELLFNNFEVARQIQRIELDIFGKF